MIHRYQKKGLNFVLDVNSGAVHLLDDISYAVSGLLDENMGDTCPQSIIDALSDYTADEIREAYDELYELKKAGQLFAQDDYIDVSRYIPVNAPVKALCLHVAHDCNLRCKYCFASTGDFGQGRKIMPPEIAKKAIDFVIARSGVRHNAAWRRSITRSSASPSPPTVCCSMRTSASTSTRTWTTACCRSTAAVRSTTSSARR